MIDKLLLKLRARDDIGADEEAALRALPATLLDVPRSRTIVQGGDLCQHSTLLIEGLMCRYKDMRDGSRQISELHVAGDFVDLHSFTLKRLDHSIMALTPCRIAQVPHTALMGITETLPHLTRMLWFTTNLDAAIHRSWVAALGRQSALARTAHLMCELYYRLRIVGLTDGLSYGLPITQGDLAECLGLTAVHVNRTLRAIRERGLAEFRGATVTILDLAGLEAVGEFEPDYLSIEKLPR